MEWHNAIGTDADPTSHAPTRPNLTRIQRDTAPPLRAPDHEARLSPSMPELRLSPSTLVPTKTILTRQGRNGELASTRVLEESDVLTFDSRHFKVYPRTGLAK